MWIVPSDCSAEEDMAEARLSEVKPCSVIATVVARLLDRRLMVMRVDEMLTTKQ